MRATASKKTTSKTGNDVDVSPVNVTSQRFIGISPSGLTGGGTRIFANLSGIRPFVTKGLVKNWIGQLTTGFACGCEHWFNQLGFVYRLTTASVDIDARAALMPSAVLLLSPWRFKKPLNHLLRHFHEQMKSPSELWIAQDGGPSRSQGGGDVVKDVVLQSETLKDQLEKNGNVLEISGFTDLSEEGDMCNKLRKGSSNMTMGTHQCVFRDICVVLGHPHLELLLRDALGHPHLDLLLRDVLGHPHLDLLLPDALGHPHLDLLLRDALGHPGLELLIPDSYGNLHLGLLYWNGKNSQSCSVTFLEPYVWSVQRLVSVDTALAQQYSYSKQD
ncbi:hypothetical protein MAR_000028 [Mya arenaria]|uniref:Uncharacterized protein n=1 Tax=Mya arenaria TaxID=6604 RepID=A0ABY7F8A3_MYAAR|nr:hypothetical protein MAR_000028 [Mya arenaria]